MKSLICAVLLVMPSLVMANESSLVEVGNKMCPVSENKIGSMGKGLKVEYNGKTYSLCCKMCKKDFDADPAKFAEIAEKEVAGEQK